MSMLHKISIRQLIMVLCIILVAALLCVLARDRLQASLPILKPEIVYAAPARTATNNLVWPAYGQAAVGASGYGVLATNGTRNPVPTASIAKLITALAVLKVKPLTVGEQGPILTLGQNDVNYYNTYVTEGGSVVPVTVGEQISEYQVIQAMLLPSANNMADSLASWAFGSLVNYETYANRMVAALGLSQTRIGSDASGFLPATTSTASDLVRLGELAAANPIIAGIASQSTATIPVAGTVKNVNWLLGTAGINGIKTGNTSQAGGVFIFSAPYQVAPGHTVTLIGAIMQAPTLQKAMDSALPLLTSSQKAFSVTSTVASGQVVGQYRVPWGGTVTAATTQAVKSLAWQGRALDKPTITLSSVAFPQLSGAVVGKVSYSQAADNTAGSSPVRLTKSIPKPSVWWRLLHG